MVDGMECRVAVHATTDCFRLTYAAFRVMLQELDTSFENVIVVDNLPVVPPEKVEKLIGKLSPCLLLLGRKGYKICAAEILMKTTTDMLIFRIYNLTTHFRLVLEGPAAELNAD